MCPAAAMFDAYTRRVRQMARASTTRFFSRGVADPSGSRAFVRDRSGTVLALDLRTGEMLWRAARGLRALAVVDDMLVAAHVSAPSALEIVILDTADGRVRRVSERLPLPWVLRSLDDTSEFTLRTEAEGRSVVIWWSAQARYQGGAPPSTKVRETFERDAHGAARVDLDTGAVELLPESTEVTDDSVGQPATSTAEPNVLEQQELGDKRFQLVADTQAGGAIKVLIRAVDRASGKMVWETLIEEAPQYRPKRLRP